MFDIPSNPNIEKCVITKETVINGADPELVINEEKNEPVKLTMSKRQVTNKSNKETA